MRTLPLSPRTPPLTSHVASASGLGRATIHNLISAGANISILDLNASSGEALVQELTPNRARFFSTDVSSTDSIATAVQGTLEWIQQTGREDHRQEWRPA